MKKHPLKISILAVAWSAIGALCSCKPASYTYKITFADGSSEYFNLNYKPKATDKAITYEGETILGVEKIEPLK